MRGYEKTCKGSCYRLFRNDKSRHNQSVTKEVYYRRSLVDRHPLFSFVVFARLRFNLLKNISALQMNVPSVAHVASSSGNRKQKTFLKRENRCAFAVLLWSEMELGLSISR